MVVTARVHPKVHAHFGDPTLLDVEKLVIQNLKNVETTDAETQIEQQKRTYAYVEQVENSKYKPRSQVNQLAALEQNRLPSIFSEQQLKKQGDQKCAQILKELYEEHQLQQSKED